MDCTNITGSMVLISAAKTDTITRTHPRRTKSPGEGVLDQTDLQGAAVISGDPIRAWRANAASRRGGPGPVAAADSPGPARRAARGVPKSVARTRRIISRTRTGDPEPGPADIVDRVATSDGASGPLSR